ncbi:MAG: Na+/H+ antiporter subunit D [Anaerolineae bacterium]|nr:Na+/H+ antiporter subunit D [Anaerolineae bacterium]
MNQLVVLPLLLPLLTAISCLLAWKRPRLQRYLSITGGVLLLITTLVLLWQVWEDGIQVVQIGNWSAPFGITFVADLFSAIMVLLTAIVGLAVAIYSLASIDGQREAFGFHALFQILLMGVCGAFLTGDLFNLYVWFEVMLIASFVLLALGGERAQIEGAIKYVTLNLISSALFLAAIGILYAIAGTLNMADLARQLRTFDQPMIITALSMLFLVAFGIKAAVFPLFFWLPASYHTPPVAVSALFAGLLTKVGVYALIRVFTLLFIHNTDFTHTLILVIAGLTMVTGVLGAVAQNEFRRILSFHIISQIGYMIMGLGLFTPLALTGSVFYIIHHIIVKTNLFLISGIAHRLQGTYELKKLGGLYRDHFLVAIFFLISAFSLAGIPPLSGFWAKMILVRAGLEVADYVIVVVALVVSILTVYSMTKIWAEAFWKPKPPSAGETAQAAPAQPAVLARHPLLLYLIPVAMLAGITVLIGLSAEPIFQLTSRAAEQLLNPAAYIEAVLRNPF